MSPHLVLNEIIRAASDQGSRIRILDAGETDRLIEQLRRRYAANGSSTFLWEDIRSRVSVRDAEAWRWIGDFLASESTIMLIINESPVAIEFVNGNQVTSLLDDTYGFEFYLINRALEYLLCFNHHDVLIAAGSAVDWLRERKQGGAGSVGDTDRL
jgi:hypothetical protein